MCFSGCKHENRNGECTLHPDRFTLSWICPPDRAKCEVCGRIVDHTELDDGVCMDCEQAGKDDTCINCKFRVGTFCHKKKHHIETDYWCNEYKEDK